MSQQKKTKREWHLYSALTITSILAFIGIQFFSGTPQVIGTAFSALIGTFLFASTEWKNQPIKVHVWLVAIPCFLFLLIVGKMVVGQLICLKRGNCR